MMTNKKYSDDANVCCVAETFEKSMQEKPKRMFEPHMRADDDPEYVRSAPPALERHATN